MNPRPKTSEFSLTEILMIAGILAMILAKMALITDSTGLNILISIIGFILWMWGCFRMTVEKGLPVHFGFLGLLSILGLFLIIEIARAEAKRKAVNPDREQRSEPDSLY